MTDALERARAVAAWRRRFGSDDARWRSIPAPVRNARRTELDALRGQPGGEGAEPDLPGR